MGSDQLQVRLLGRFAVTRDGEEVPLAAFGGRLARRLFRLLVCHEGDLVPRDVLADALWAEHPPADPAANLKVLVSRARRVVGEAVRTGPGGYRFDPAVCEVDAHRFLTAVADASGLLREGELDAAASAFDGTLATWSGEPLPEDTYELWADAPRRRLLDAYLEALEGGAAAAIARGAPARAVELASIACDREPLREGAHLLLARALLAAGDRGRGLAVLRGLIDRTAAELGLDPSPAVQRLQSALLTAGEPVAGLPVTGPPRSAHPAPPTAPLLPFVERGGDRGRVLAATRTVPPRPVVVAGGPGSGKTRLLEEVAAQVPVPLRVGAHSAERDQDGSLLRDVVRAVVTARPHAVDALHGHVGTALSTLVPEIGDAPAAAALDARSRRSLLTEGIVALLGAAARDRSVLLVDDLQWADPTSLGLLAAAVARVPDLGVVVGLRPGGDDHDAAVDRFVAQLHRGPRPVCEVALGPLTADGLASIAVEPLAAILVEHTDGSPFAVTEAVAALRADDVVTDRPDGRLAPRADAVADELVAAAQAGHARSIHTRVSRQPAARRELVELVALLGRAAPARLLAVATRRETEPVLADLDALTRGGLLRATGRGWVPAHHLTATAVVAGIDATGRRRHHRHLADALQQLDGDQGELAVHLEAGGDATAAARAHAQAASLRLERAATEEAAHHAAAGLRLVAAGALRRDLLRTHADAVASRGELAEARADLREALRDAGDGPERAGLLTRLALLSLGADDLERAGAMAARALLEAGDEPAARARALSVAAVVDMNQRRPERSRERSDEALRLFDQIGDPGGVAGILDARAMAQFLDGDITGAVTSFHRVACAFEDAGQLLQVITPRSTRGHALVFAARPADGLAEADAATELADALGHAEGQAYARWHRSEALTALGHHEAGLATAEAALAIATRIGHRGWTATANLARGLALAAGSDDAGAAAAYRTALDLTASLPLFHGWAAARLARRHVAAGRPDDAAPLVETALAVSPPLGGYEARLADVELRLATGDPDAGGALVQARTEARRGGHLASAAVLDALADSPGLTGRP